MSDDFLARWSRRKLEVRRQDRDPAPLEAPAPEARAPDEMPAQETEPELTPEEIEALPPVEELTADSDFRLFLRKGVPERLKNAALRRMWALDPSIRDHVGDARDYAYDWNVPGGVPGAGPLLPTDDVSGMLRQIFQGPAAADQQGHHEAADPVRLGRPSQVGEQESTPGVDAASGAGSPEHVTGPASEEDPQSDALPVRKGMISTASPDAAPEEPSERELPPSVPPRRHGRARPT
jgi:hypothetical protein